MSSVRTPETAVPAIRPWSATGTARLADYLELSKPRIAVMALLTVTLGYGLGSRGSWEWMPLAYALVGIASVAVSSSVLNQFLERDTDARMRRTARRPLPSGRISPTETLVFGIVTGVAGVAWLALFVNLLTAIMAVVTLFLYVAVYTPLKRHTSLCTTIGAIPGALPPVLGWTAATGRLDLGAFVLFAILFVWQFPHFLAICYIYRHDYAAAGLRMLPKVEPPRGITGFMAVAYALALVPVSLLPRHAQLAGLGYDMAAIVLGLGYLFCAVLFLLDENERTARRLLWASLVYLPLLLTALTWNQSQLLS